MVKVLASFVQGPLAPYVEGFAAQLLREGYTPAGAGQHVCFIAHLDRWLAAAGLDVADLDAVVLDRYLAARRSSGYVQYLSVKALRPLLDYLTPLGVLSAPGPVEHTPAEAVLADYRNYLLTERGLTAGTARGYVDVVRPFVARQVRAGSLNLSGLDAADVTSFVLAACPGRAVGSAKLILCALRSFLNWLHLTGITPVSWASAAPAVAGWRLSGLPKGLEPGQLRKLLASCDRRTRTGRRDYAILLLLSRLGLRAGEVAGLGLDDIDWRRGELTISGKGNRIERLPLPDDVGAAVTAYLRRGRPATAQGRTVFVRVHAPHRAMTPGGVTMVVFDNAQRAELGKLHAHQLRHTAATAMLRAGSPLAEVGQVLRHRSPLTTAIYAKVDRDALAVLARPWPGAAAGGAS